MRELRRIKDAFDQTSAASAQRNPCIKGKNGTYGGKEEIGVTKKELATAWTESERGARQGDCIIFWMWTIVALGAVALLTLFVRWLWYY